MKLDVSQIKAGDRFGNDHVGWTAIEDAVSRRDGTVTLRVQFAGDGGLGTREWGAGHELEITR